MSAVAVVGMACRYPDARSPRELWENVLAQRRAFRPVPPQRLRLADYGAGPDGTYLAEAAVLEGWEFDRVRFRVSGESYRAADLAHWLALEVAEGALADAGFAGGAGLPREQTGVLLGNSLTGEFSRAGLMRLRWPYVRRVVQAALAESGGAPEDAGRWMASLESTYKAPFPEPGGETLAGGLSNTIAGRICNHWDLGGGGYTVDGACASSLLAVANACSALAAGDLDVAIAGGVDLSLDPFELVGFARAGALSRGEMRVYDRSATGFLPGEGCALVVLMRLEDAVALGRRPRAVIRGWGVSSDGSGGLTRPEAEGQGRALRRAYARAGWGPQTVAYFEGHGTGTEVGDATELRALSAARRAAGDAPPAVVGSVKAVIGHTKAAAGVAGLVKAVMALDAQVVPPTAGCRTPHAVLQADDAVLRVAAEAEAWPDALPLRAGVSAMGFGGINVHVALEAAEEERRADPTAAFAPMLRAAQDAELFLLDAGDAAGLRRAAEALRERGALLSRAELGDAAAALHGRLTGGPVRAALVTGTAAELAARLNLLLGWLADGRTRAADGREGVFLGAAGAAPRIGFLFPGQGSPANRGGGLARRRFGTFAAAYGRASLPDGGDGTATEVAQPAIAAASAAALALLREWGVEASVALGHSLGELVALHWAGSFDVDALLRTATVRGRAMAELGTSGGAMLAVGAGRAETEALLAGTEARVGGVNAPARTVVTGPAEAVDTVAERARARGWEAQRLAVSHAFHSPLVAAAAAPLAAHLAGEALRPPRRAVASTVTGRVVEADEDLRALLVRQVTDPVLFAPALGTVADGVDLWIEVGPGHVLAGLAAGQVDAPVIATDAGGASLAGLLAAAGAAFAFGAPVRTERLFADRFVRPIDLDHPPRFLVNPCELAPAGDGSAPAIEVFRVVGDPSSTENEAVAGADAGRSAIEVVRALVAERAELPASAVGDHDLLLGDLHLNSLVVGQMVGEAARRLGLGAPSVPTEYAAATVAQVAEALEQAAASGPARAEDPVPAGVDAWVRAFIEREEPTPLVPRATPEASATWAVLGDEDDPRAAELRGAAIPGPGGVIVCLPAALDGSHAERLLRGAGMHAERPDGAFVVVQRGGGGGGFARSLSLERPAAAVLVIDAPFADKVADLVAAECGAALPGPFVEARYGADGVRREPVLEAHPIPPVTAAPLGAQDVVLVTGGGKGIAAECALALSKETGAKLLLLGRARPENDAALAAGLARFAAHGAVFAYHAADAGDADAVAAAVRAGEAALGPVTAVLHGAGVNVPRRIEQLDADALRQTLRPKLDGLRAVLAAIDPARLRLLVAFGSIIGRAGLDGEAHYALANEWMRREVERFASTHPHVRALCLEWSVWSGVGMGERLGTLEALTRRGISPVPLDAGIAAFRALVASPPSAVSAVVAGRFGPPPTVRLAAADLPLFRFLERPRVHYPGVELVADATLSPDTDPYLEDHVLAGERVFPAVLGLEAMAQAAMAAAGRADAPRIEDAVFARPVLVPAEGGRVIRLAALVRGDGEVEVALRSDETAFAVDHFHARCRFGAEPEPLHPPMAEDGGGEVMEDADALYGGLLFQGGRFRRVRGYTRIEARACVAELSPDGSTRWFGAFAPAARVLGDPGARDAAIHAIQPCIPHLRLVPTGIERLTVLGGRDDDARVVRATERGSDGETFVYDLTVWHPDGTLLERWTGLRLRRVSEVRPDAGWPLALVRNHLQRRLEELTGRDVSVWLEDAADGRAARGDRARRRLLGEGVPLHRRADGRPDGAAHGGTDVSISHAGDCTLALAAAGPVGCDLEPVRARPAEDWADLLGRAGMELAALVAREAGEAHDAACTRVWAAREAVRKAGALDCPLRLRAAGRDGWVVLAAGRRVVPTAVLPFPGGGTAAFAAAVGEVDDARPGESAADAAAGAAEGVVGMHGVR
jgi:enediyne polyketide synthase